MSHPDTFAALGLAEPLLRAIADAGYDRPTPIQAQAIPLVLQGGDVRAAAQTGTGKTASFTLPILQRLTERPRAPRPHQPRCLILTPTRELAAQVEESVRTYGRYVPVKSMVMFGGVGMMPQVQALKKAVDILVATPGRLLDHCGEKNLDLSQIEIFVLDEADRMLDMGFIRDIRRIMPLLPANRQNLMFSATFSEEIRQLADGLLRNPGSVEVARRNAASELVQQTVHLVHKEHKRDLLSHLIRQQRWQQVLVFTRTKHGANRLAEKLEKDGIAAAAIHGNKSQGARTRALAQFKDGTVPVLVATDIAARGLDIDQLPQVVNFELPNVPEDYVHRIGRTGRAGSSGAAVSLVDGEEMQLLAGIEKLLKRKIDRVAIEGFVPPAPRPGKSDADERPDRGPRRDGRAPERDRDPQRNVNKHHRHTPSHTQPREVAPQRDAGQRRDDGRPRQGQPQRQQQPQGQQQPRGQQPRQQQGQQPRQQQPQRDSQQQRRQPEGGGQMSEAARHQAQPQPALFRPAPVRRYGR